MLLPSAAQRLTVCVLVGEGSEPFRETLRSVQSIADEVIAVDTGSSPEAAELAKSYGAVLVNHTWSDDFAAARNAGTAAAGGDWVLWLDAGEQLTPENASRLREIVLSSAFPRSAYALHIEVPAAGPRSAAEQIAQLRLFPRHAELQFAGRVRESVAASLSQRRLFVDTLPVRIHRGAREHEPQRRALRAARNLRLAELELREGQARPELLNCLGESLQTLQQYGKAGDCYRQALVFSARGSAEMLEAYYGLITSLDPTPERRSTQIALCTKALEVFPLDTPLLCATGQYLQAAGQTELAVRSFQTAVEHGQVNPLVWHAVEVREIATICLCICWNKLGEAARASSLLQQALDRNPDSVQLREYLEADRQRSAA